jgi:hypothetical protein
VKRFVGLARVLVAFVFAGCSASSGDRVTRAPSGPAATPLAALLAVALCPEALGRTFSLASSSDGVLDTFLRVERCRARAERDEVRVSADAAAWMAVDRDLGPIGLTAVVHATVHVEVRARVSARAAGRSLAITFAPLGDASVSVVPVGALEPSARDWAALAAIELAPSIGVSPEALAKRQVQKESERALRAALARAVTVTYDAKAGALIPAEGAPGANIPRLRVLPGGSAEIGGFRPTRASTEVRVRSTQSVAARGVCLSHAKHLRDADRRGDAVTVFGWPAPRGDSTVEVPPMPCPWTFAVRAIDDRGGVVTVEPPTVEEDGQPVASAPDRWVAFDEVSLDPPIDDPLLGVTLSTDAWHYEVGSPGGSLPTVTILAPDEHFVVRLTRRERDQLVTEEEAPLAFDGPGDFSRQVALATRDGAVRTTVRFRARVRVPEVLSSP